MSQKEYSYEYFFHCVASLFDFYSIHHFAHACARLFAGLYHTIARTIACGDDDSRMIPPGQQRGKRFGSKRFAEEVALSLVATLHFEKSPLHLILNALRPPPIASGSLAIGNDRTGKNAIALGRTNVMDE